MDSDTLRKRYEHKKDIHDDDDDDDDDDDVVMMMTMKMMTMTVSGEFLPAVISISYHIQ